jgi:hypothetical protein
MTVTKTLPNLHLSLLAGMATVMSGPLMVRLETNSNSEV